MPVTVGAAVVAVVAVLLTVVGLPSQAGSRPVRVSALAPAPDAAAPVPVPASRDRVVLPVAPLRALRQPDLFVTTARPLTASQIVALRRVRGVTASTVLSTGVVRVGRRAVNTLGVDPSTFRPFTPKPTAQSDPLWASIARGELAPSYAAQLPLGQMASIYLRHTVSARIGAVAAYELPLAGLVVDRSVARAVGLPQNGVVLAAPDRSIQRLQRDVTAILGDGALMTVLRPVKIDYRRPATYRDLYQLSARYCPGLSWTVLAAIGQVESGHGRDVGPSSAGALGPMQFLPSTWASYGVDGDGDGKADIMSAYDAVPAASLYLCHNGAGRGGQALYDAIFAYNHADWYVREVLALAARYR